jgi:GTP cyclohydrolase I
MSIEKAAQHIKNAMKELGFYDNMPTDFSEHIKDTPKRIAKAWTEFMFKSADNLDFSCTSFSAGSVDNLQIVKDVSFNSICAHHFFPFFGTCHLAYLPNTQIIGLSKIPRLIKFLSAQPHIQEMLVCDIADVFFEIVQPKFVMVMMVDVTHTCCSCRGIKSNSTFISSAIRSIEELDSNDIKSLKDEALNLLKQA